MRKSEQQQGCGEQQKIPGDIVRILHSSAVSHHRCAGLETDLHQANQLAWIEMKPAECLDQVRLRSTNPKYRCEQALVGVHSLLAFNPI